jgi:lysophospholipase L1-like esterase
MNTLKHLGKLIAAGIVVIAVIIVGFRVYNDHFGTKNWEAAHFEDEIAAFEAQDRTNRPALGQVLFIGSSSIRRWQTLERDMQPVAVLNRGFGGSMLHHSTHFADRVITPYKPSAIVIYAGDNDIGNLTMPRSAVQVAMDFDAFTAKVRADVGDIPIVYIAIKPSVFRAAQWPEMQRANAMIADRAQTDPQIYFADVASPMLDQHGKADEQFLVSDGLHMNAKGYAVWTSIIRPILLDISTTPRNSDGE